jgi:hypothetical protein
MGQAQYAVPETTTQRPPLEILYKIFDFKLNLKFFQFSVSALYLWSFPTPILTLYNNISK